MDGAENSVPIQVVLLVDPQSSTPKQSSEIIPQPISEDHNHRSVSEFKDEHIKEESKPEDEHIKEDSESEDEEEDHNKCNNKLRDITKWAAFIVITASLICTFTIPSLVHKTFWGLELWKWCLTIFVVFCGRIVSGWLVSFVAFIIEVWLHHTFVYVDPDLYMGVQNCVWLGLVFLIWKLMFTPDVQVPGRSHRLLNKVTRALIVVLVGSMIWVVKIVVMKMATTSFHFSRFFNQIRENIVLLYIIHTLSTPSRWREIRRYLWKKSMGIDPKDLTKLRRKNLSWWNANRLVRHIKLTRLSEDRKAEATAGKIFKNVAKTGARYIEKDDLLKYLNDVAVDHVFHLCEVGREAGKIEESAVTKMVVNAYQKRKYLVHSLNDTEELMQQLHKLVNAVFIVVIIIASLLVTGVTTTNVIVVITSQLLLMGFIFGNTCKTMFESMVFLLTRNPFDVGDHCVIDGIEMVVKKMEVFTTKFLCFDDETIIYYPNGELLTKPITNFSRSRHIGDIIEFSVDVSIPLEIIKERIKGYINKNPMHWQPRHSVVVKSVGDLNKMKIALYVIHTENFQDSWERNNRRSNLVIELKNIFDELGMINYNLPAQRIILPQSTTAPHCDSMTQG